MKKMKSSALVSSLVAASFVLISLICIQSSAYAQKKVDKISFLLDWAPQGRFAAFYTANAKGYYAENGIEVNIMRGYGAIKTAQSVDQGQAEFGIADMSAVVVNVAKGAKITAVGIMHDLSPQGFDSLKSAGITKPKDLEGKKMASEVGGGARSILPALYKQNNVDASKIQLAALQGAVYIPALLRGDVDVIPAFRGSTHAVLVYEAKKKGLEVNRINVSDFGLDIYGAAIITGEKMIKENPDLVRSFVEATYKGMRYAIDHPDEATDIIMKLHPELVREIVRSQWQDAIEMSQTPAQKKMGYGYMAENKMKRTRDIVLSGYDIKEEVPLSKLYTNEFLPRKQ